MYVYMCAGQQAFHATAGSIGSSRDIGKSCFGTTASPLAASVVPCDMRNNAWLQDSKWSPALGHLSHSFARNSKVEGIPLCLYNSMLSIQPICTPTLTIFILSMLNTLVLDNHLLLVSERQQ